MAIRSSLHKEDPHPVFSAIHGEGSWNPTLVAPTLDVFRDCLAVFRRFAAGRSSPVELDENPPPPDQQAQFLGEIRRLTNGEEEAVGFWAVQVEVDLDSFEG